MLPHFWRCEASNLKFDIFWWWNLLTYYFNIATIWCFTSPGWFLLAGGMLEWSYIIYQYYLRTVLPDFGRCGASKFTFDNFWWWNSLTYYFNIATISCFYQPRLVSTNWNYVRMIIDHISVLFKKSAATFWKEWGFGMENLLFSLWFLSAQLNTDSYYWIIIQTHTVLFNL